MLYIILNTATAESTPLFTTGDIIALIAVLIALGVYIINGISKGAIKNKNIEDLCNSSTQIKSSIIDIKDSIVDLKISNTRIVNGLITVGCNPDILRATSPHNLTVLGEEILNDIGGKIYIDANEQDLISKIKNLNPKSELDVEDFSKQVLFDEFDSDNFIPIKNFIYNNPLYKNVPLNQATIITILGIYLRNKYFLTYPTIPII